MKIFLNLSIFLIILLANLPCYANIPNAPIKASFGTTIDDTNHYTFDFDGNLVQKYYSFRSLNNISKFLPTDLVKIAGTESTNFSKYFFLNAAETYDKTNQDLVMTSILVGGGAEEKIYSYLTSKYGTPNYSYEINDKYPNKWFEPKRVVIWEEEEYVMLLFTEYTHGLRSKISVMTREFYDSLNHESRYLKE